MPKIYSVSQLCMQKTEKRSCFLIQKIDEEVVWNWEENSPKLILNYVKIPFSPTANTFVLNFNEDCCDDRHLKQIMYWDTFTYKWNLLFCEELICLFATMYICKSIQMVRFGASFSRFTGASWICEIRWVLVKYYN